MKVDGTTVSTFTTTRGGAGTLWFTTGTPRANQEVLDFDPRGKVLAINNGVADVLVVTFSGTGEPSNISVQEVTDLANAGAAPERAKATSTYRSVPSGLKSFEVRVQGLPEGTYDLQVAGIPRQSIEVNRAGRGFLRFSSSPRANQTTLNFDPRNQQIQILQGTTVFFTGNMIAQVLIPDVNTCEPSTKSQALAATQSAPPGASATGTLIVRTDCGRHFQVQVQGLLPGDYQLFVGSSQKGTITVAANPPPSLGTQGGVNFDTTPTASENLLDFDPIGQVVEVRQATPAATYFSSTFNP
jgi:hypothetical protein